MKIVIDIPEERYEFIKGLDNTCYDIHAAIAQGTPLPKGYGDLISREALKKALEKSTVTIIGYGEAILLDTANELIDTAPSVITADK